MQKLNSMADLKKKQGAVNPSIMARLRERTASARGDRRAKVKRQSDRLESCASFLHLREWTEHQGQITVKQGNFCKNHLACQPCAMIRARKNAKAYGEKIGHVLDQRPELVPAMVTLSLKNTSDLDEGIARIRKAIACMMADRRKALSTSCRNEYRNEWCKVLGSIKAMEVTNKGRGWHPHFHVLCLIDEYIDQKKLSREWQAYTGDSFIVDVRQIDDLQKGVYEVLKYVTKFSELTGEQIADLHLALGGKRLIDPQGLLRGVVVPDSFGEEDLTGDFNDLWAIWNRRNYTLLQTLNTDLPDDFPGAREAV